MPTTSLTLRRPDDMHAHFRDGAMLRTVVPATALVFGRAIVMPNLKPPVTTTAQASTYKNEILAAIPKGANFTPLMTLYLTDHTDVNDLESGHRQGLITAAKLYPAGATTNSDLGVTNIKNLTAVLARMEKIGMPLLMHGEVADPTVDIFDREAVFIDHVLIPLRKDFPALKIVFEHITTHDAAAYVIEEGSSSPLAATITPQHILLNRNSLLAGGLKPHHYCMPIVKREEHRRAVLAAATSGKPMFFLGTDTAPHPRAGKECACGCAGVFSAQTAIALYAQAFDAAGALDKLEAFASLNGAAFYGLPPAQDTITLERTATPLPPPPVLHTEDGDEIVSFSPPDGLFWRVSSL